MVRIRIRWEKGEVTGVLRDTPTAKAIIEALPFSSRANTWGKEVYFEAPVKTKLESDARQVVDLGTICFWVQGSCLALPFGPTPVSQGQECRLVTNVNVLGKLEGDPDVLESVKDGDAIRVELAGEPAG